MHNRPQDQVHVQNQSQHRTRHRPRDRQTSPLALVARVAGSDPEPTRILVVGDTHGANHWLRAKVIPHALANRCQRIVQVGDFGFVWDNDRDAVDWEMSRLDLMLTRAGLLLHFLPGSCDNHPMLTQLAGRARRSAEGHYMLRPSIYYTGRISDWQWRDVRFAAVGGVASSVQDGRIQGQSWWPEEQLSDAEVVAAQQVGAVDVLFTHDAPAEMPCVGLSPHVPTAGSRETMSKIGRALQPKLWTHGHYHRSLTYQFRSDDGPCAVRGLDRDGARLDASTAVLDLERFRASVLGQST
jgi:hypothetical protein